MGGLCRIVDSFLFVYFIFISVTSVILMHRFVYLLTVASVYGFIAKKSWISMTCLIYGVSILSCLIVILTEMIKSKRASEKMFMVYLPFLVVAVLAVLRGLIPCSGGGSAASARISAAPRKKRT
ncbi:hypothetical protein Sjap_003253 [Stephania japonica]|uniref:Uncharacterized protein n=1 Tax=Stephania japonica TaxID=461633 RepID=A0AAP0KNE9_9MAGN